MIFNSWRVEKCVGNPYRRRLKKEINKVSNVIFIRTDREREPERVRLSDDNNLSRVVNCWNYYNNIGVYVYEIWPVAEVDVIIV